MTECNRCGAKSTVFLCPRCITTVRQVLTDLPWWLERLTEAAVGQTRMSDNGGRRSAPRDGLDGEKPLAACIEQLPDNPEHDLDKARRDRQKNALRHALAAGGINTRASELLGEISDSLAYWVKELCDSRGVQYEPPTMRRRWNRTLGVEHAAWLAVHVDSIAASELADDITGDIETHLDDIIEAVNRPERLRFLGPCPSWIQHRNDICGRELRAKPDDIEIHCRRCKTTHNTNRIMLARRDEYEHTPKTFEELSRFNRDLPDEYRISLRTMQHWRQTGTLKPRGWLRPGGERGIARHGDSDQPLYLWADMRRLAIAKPQKKTTGAAAHERICQT